MIEKILVPTDGSAFSERAFDYAIHIAKLSGAHILALHVIYVPPPKPLDPTGISRRMVRQGEICLESLKKKGKDAGLDINTKLTLSRSVSEAILKEASDGEFDLIVMGSHGLTGFRKFVLGSVSEAVVRRSVCPVLVVK